MTADQVRALLERHFDDLADVVALRIAAADESERPAARSVSAEQAEGILDDLSMAMAVELGARELVAA